MPSRRDQPTAAADHSFMTNDDRAVSIRVELKARSESSPENSDSLTLHEKVSAVRLTSISRFGFSQTSKSVIIHHKQTSLIRTTKTGGQMFRDTSPYKVNEYYLTSHNLLQKRSKPVQSITNLQFFWQRECDYQVKADLHRSLNRHLSSGRVVLA